ncbi:MAG: T9SS type A sorting domain-containing protein, partial [Candidatus Cloacimonadales bacterium]|nr:T9SS type A sorting domain-containing protein [Candidatus Cloacimonadales bacterium]
TVLSPITLHQNYPNPFNPSTTIEFSTTNLHELTQIVIYNLKGQVVKTFSNLQITQSPNQQVTWNGTDDSGKAVSSGVYFYKIKSGDTEVSKKMLLLK